MSQSLRKRNHYWNLCSPLKTIILLKILASEKTKNLNELCCDCSSSLANFLPILVTVDKENFGYACKQVFINVAPIRIIPKGVYTSYRPNLPGKTFAVLLGILKTKVERYAILDVGGNFITTVDHSTDLDFGSITTLNKFFQKYTKRYKDF